ncbi:amino acid permease [Listeria newyorkensis]|uniref:APC family permease n=1 Tax=Listeria newyorkensis TaxID=1497681 RepID=A0A841YY29_9LIST|nr:MULTISPECIES: APC family permease [Listeria]KGL46503.1 amino acid permease [Listeriaceae bacterium FSL A5-0209]KGL46791.1 amino acid permease [Listeria newyorkensis]KMT62976.1 APC family amino acid-polyamine-organocation transporter [Listeria newyorkensis]MBC1458218.1 APC family permease [Listeria newyorkensis]PNP87105.1 amino acid permease [Listeria newyorkensis]
MGSPLKRMLIGRPLKSSEAGDQKLGKLKALAVLSSDALSSVAYGTEQILLVLITVGATAMWYSLPIALCVLVLLFALSLSYRQIIYAYPQGGGAYVVSRENIGKNAGLIAGGSLLVDYMLTVAVSVSSGTDAIVAAIPSLYQFTVPLAIILVIVVTIINLRGVTESATILAVPVYLFVFSMIVMIVTGLVKLALGQDVSHETASVGTHVSGVTLILLLRAFASGSASLTGIEAISNAVPLFKDPKAKNASRTLIMMASILGFFFVGVTLLAYFYGVVPELKSTVLSQIAENIFGRNFFYYFIQATTALILVLAANTGFSAFPMLAFNLSKDKYMPRMYLDKGDRLGYSNGIITLALGSILLIILFQGKTESLIPLYSVGVFIPFTLSQTGMIIKWVKEKPEGYMKKLSANLLGALISFTVLMVLFITRITEVWPVFIFMPAMIYVFHRTRSHYAKLAPQLRIDEQMDLPAFEGNAVIICVSDTTKVVEGALRYAKSIGDTVIAVHVSLDKQEGKEFVERWNRIHPEVRIADLYSTYRSITEPLMKFIDTAQQKANQDNYSLTVLIPQFIPKKGWQNILHNQTSLLIRTKLLFKKDVVVATYPYHLKE